MLSGRSKIVLSRPGRPQSALDRRASASPCSAPQPTQAPENPRCLRARGRDLRPVHRALAVDQVSTCASSPILFERKVHKAVNVPSAQYHPTENGLHTVLSNWLRQDHVFRAEPTSALLAPSTDLSVGQLASVRSMTARPANANAAKTRCAKTRISPAIST
jgi:hypothetical protein